MVEFKKKQKKKNTFLHASQTAVYCVSYRQFARPCPVSLSVVYYGGADPLAAAPTELSTFRNNIKEMLTFYYTKKKSLD